MTTTKEFYDAFWQEFIQSMNWPSPTVGSPRKAVHARPSSPKNYYDFDRDFGNGFRPTVGISKQKDHLLAQLSTHKSGRHIVEKLKADYPMSSHAIEPYVHLFVSDSDAKIELIWHNAEVENRKLWPVHHLWLRNSLELLTSIYNPILSGASR